MSVQVSLKFQNIGVTFEQTILIQPHVDSMSSSFWVLLCYEIALLMSI